MKKLFRILAIALALLLLGLFGLLWYVTPITNGYAAKYICSNTFNSGLDPDQGFREYVVPISPIFQLERHRVNTDEKSVTVSFLGFLRPRTARWQPGCGCTLEVEGARAARPNDSPNNHAIPVEDSVGLTPSSAWNWTRWNREDSLADEIPWPAIDSILDYGMAETTDDPRLKTNTLAPVVAWNDRILGERYAKGVTETTPVLGWSATKSVLGALIGVLVQTRGLDIHQPAGLPEWSADARREITIDQLLRMESGLEFDEDYAGRTDATEMLYNSSSMGAFAARARAKVPPDSVWSYSSGTTNILSRILFEKVGGTKEAMDRFLQEAFLDKLGIASAIWEHDESGPLVGSSYLYMAARDWMRVCRLFMQDGVWEGERILPEGWVRYCLTPTPHTPDARYGAHVWLNAASDPEQRILPGLPKDLFLFNGFQGQRVIGVPSRGLMLVRLGVDNQRRWDAVGVVKCLLDALPAQ